MMNKYFLLFSICVALLISPRVMNAASLFISPETGVYTSGKTFTVSVRVNTNGASINAADATLTFNPNELSVVSVNRTTSIFNLWTSEPSYSNTAGTISFAGGSPTGYKGSNGTILTATMKSKGSGAPKIQIANGSILAADGLGTNVLTTMKGGTYTISAEANNPEPEYITPPNTPGTPEITSTTHSNRDLWYQQRMANLGWAIPSGVVALRTLLDTSPSSIPTKEYTELITERTLEDLEEGTSYFHLQFKNAEGWGKIAHFPLRVDTKPPQDFSIHGTPATTEDDPIYKLIFIFNDVSPVTQYKIKRDLDEPVQFEDSENKKEYAFTELAPGYHTVIVEAIDSAGNSSIASHSFTIEPLQTPKFTEYPTRLNTDVIPVIVGQTVPHARVAITIVKESDGSIVDLAHGNNGSDQFSLSANEQGVFTFIPDSSFPRGVYSIRAIAKNKTGHISLPSDPIRVVVEEPGYIVIGSVMLNILSVFVPILALLFVSIFSSWYFFHKFKVWKRRVLKETLEAEHKLTLEFSTLVHSLDEKIAALKATKKGKLVKAEEELVSTIETDLTIAKDRIAKEIADIERIIQ